MRSFETSRLKWRGDNDLDVDQTANLDATTRAESALELLKSLARADEDPDRFTQACLDWSRLSQDATSIPEFQTVLSMISAPAADLIGPNPQPAERARENDLVFSLDANGVVTSLPRDLSEFLALKTGDSVQHVSLQAGADNLRISEFQIELTDRFEIVRKVRVWPKFHDGVLNGYTARVVLSSLSTGLREHLKRVHELTTSEIDILQLVFRRLNLEQVAQVRGIKLSTVRTHISRIISKLNCRSLVEAITTTMELSHALDQERPPIDIAPETNENRVRILPLTSPGKCVAYRRYGLPSGRPVILLHSLEYGYLPSIEMAKAASERGINLIFPIPPGFGSTSPAGSTQDAASLLLEFIRALELNDVTVIGLSTAAPLALHLSGERQRISKAVLVNYGLNVTDKLKNIQPRWIRGMLRMSLNSPSSFAFGLRTLTTIIRSFGGLRFYRRLYAQQASDQAYLEQNQSLFELTSDYLVRAHSQSIRHDIVSAFLNNRALETSVHDGRDIMVINSSDQHGVGADEAKADAKRLGVQFEEAPYPGRNWLFQHPDYLFNLI